ncbi:MAG: hypothetical protein ACYDD7_20640, partial [Acidimicrobiales bacterium]
MVLDDEEVVERAHGLPDCPVGDTPPRVDLVVGGAVAGVVVGTVGGLVGAGVLGVVGTTVLPGAVVDGPLPLTVVPGPPPGMVVPPSMVVELSSTGVVVVEVSGLDDPGGFGTLYRSP